MHSAIKHNILDRPRVMEHLTRAVATNSLDRRIAQKIVDAYDLGLITCSAAGADDMHIEYTALGHIWDCQGQQWGVA